MKYSINAHTYILRSTFNVYKAESSLVENHEEAKLGPWLKLITSSTGPAMERDANRDALPSHKLAIPQNSSAISFLRGASSGRDNTNPTPTPTPTPTAALHRCKPPLAPQNDHEPEPPAGTAAFMAHSSSQRINPLLTNQPKTPTNCSRITEGPETQKPKTHLTKHPNDKAPEKTQLRN
jgi:hypothetical protein